MNVQNASKFAACCCFDEFDAFRCNCSSPSFMKVLKGPTRSVKSLIENSEALNLTHQRQQKPTGTCMGRQGNDETGRD